MARYRCLDVCDCRNATGAVDPIADLLREEDRARRRHNGATGTVLIYVGLRNRSGHACLARGRAVLALRDAKTHTLLHIYANPYARTVRRSLRRGLNNLFTLQWKNYCGPGRPLLLIVSFAGRRAVERDAYPGARCELPDIPSELRLFHVPG